MGKVMRRHLAFSGVTDLSGCMAGWWCHLLEREQGQ